MKPSSYQHPKWYWLFLLGAIPCLLFAAYTQHAWEDWYITYRAGKNLAMGYGLVFEHGQKLHTFTSPLNVLVPALFSWLTGDDAMVLRLYRVLGACLLGCTVLLLTRLVRTDLRPSAWVLMLALFVMDVKVMDYTINGQEAAFLVFFLSLTLLGLIERRTWVLGVAWAGLMWSRPDSVIYIAATGAGYFVCECLRDCRSWRSTLTLFFKAAMLAALLYGPWILWATWYYGTPIPHTVVAKGLSAVERNPLTLLYQFLTFPVYGLVNLSALNDLFVPANAFMGGWPRAIELISKVLAWAAMMAWVLPRLSPLVRTSSFGVYVGLFYLTCVTPFPYAWYFPFCTVLAVIVLAGLWDAAIGHLQEQGRPTWPVSLLAVSCVLFSLGLTVSAAWQLKMHQAIIETGMRKPIGLWLKKQAAGERQTVFVECLGYIGFFSGLKMYDYPGMSSPEMVSARRVHGEQWNDLIRALKPDWLVLRLSEARKLYAVDQDIVEALYQQVAVFDQSEKIAAIEWLPGRGYLQYDQTFVVFRKVMDTAPQALPQEHADGLTEETP